ncbi:MAG: Clp protease N-terminal domain-containing protein, partial [Geitlerinemataceae cyanobacterium]
TATFEYILKAVAFASLTDDIQPPERNLTPEAIQVMHLALDAVGNLHVDVVGTEALLLGLLAEGTSTAARVLKAAGVTFDVAQQYTLQLLGSPPTNIHVPEDEPPLAPRVVRVFELATDRAQQLQQSHITPEHLLLSILEEDEETPTQYVGVAIRILKEGFGIDLAHLKQRLREAMAH